MDMSPAITPPSARLFRSLILSLRRKKSDYCSRHWAAVTAVSSMSTMCQVPLQSASSTVWRACELCRLRTIELAKKTTQQTTFGEFHNGRRWEQSGAAARERAISAFIPKLPRFWTLSANATVAGGPFARGVRFPSVPDSGLQVRNVIAPRWLLLYIRAL
ncbi:hypothetical protein L227DRAFT_250545 [Lentinus tigrinus ALCF2SS1-6]|uniref:Uncharacterized protein n=1 Tax=Lentinus tigrinus ALCF2SS1-6 TaxID=1328759 RepID=A0A5C2S022_9APHY|nr:hypothetical protein L227DRAFT_250545 [Lentinus tigrinus ALCF2SS1-6]